jgi:hypothetical protein
VFACLSTTTEQADMRRSQPWAPPRTADLAARRSVPPASLAARARFGQSLRVCDGKRKERGAKRQGRSVSIASGQGRDEVPEAQYAYLGDDRIAHQVSRKGDLIYDRGRRPGG